MEADPRDVVGVALELEDVIGIGGLDIVQTDGSVARRREEPFVRRYAEPVYLGVGVLDCP